MKQFNHFQASCGANCVLLLLASLCAAAQEVKLVASDAEDLDRFGINVSMNQDTLVVGASWGDDACPGNPNCNSGAAYIFVRTGLNWNQVAKLIASDGAAGDEFGLSVSMSGDSILVGSGGDDDNGSGSGSAYVYQDTSGVGDWSSYSETKLLASDGVSGDRFGLPVAIDGDTAAVSAVFRNNGGGAADGVVYVFSRTGGVWNETGVLQETIMTTGDNFGVGLDIEGDTIAVGVLKDDVMGMDSGSLIVFRAGPGSDWTSPSAVKILASDGQADDRLGARLSMSGRSIVVSAIGDDSNGPDAGSAYVFTDTSLNGDWSSYAETKFLPDNGGSSDSYGNSVGIIPGVIAVGARLDDDLAIGAGSVYLYYDTSVNSDWSSYLSEKLMPSDGEAGDWFGHRLSLISGRIAIAALLGNAGPLDSGAVYVNEIATDACQQLQTNFSDEWPLMAADLGLNQNVVATPGKRVPERFGIAMVRQILCKPGHPHYVATLNAYTNNVASLESEAPAVAAIVAPYKHVLAAVLLINQARQDHFKSVLGLLNTYEVVNVPGGKAASDEIFSDDGDLDGDGYTNASEYDFIVASGGSVDDFAMAATTPGNPALSLSPMIGLLALAFLLAAGGCVFLKLDRAKEKSSLRH